jgi:hypothetical protein
MVNGGKRAAHQEVQIIKKSDKKNDKKCISKSTSQTLNFPRMYNFGVIASLQGLQ